MTQETKNPEFTLTGTINYELKFTDKGVHLTWNDQTNPARLVSLLISQQVAENAKANFMDNYDTIKKDKKLLDRFGWASKTITGLDVFVGSFIDAVIEENTLPIITSGMNAESAGLTATDITQKTDNPNTLTDETEPFCECLYAIENKLTPTKRCFGPCMAQREILEKRKSQTGGNDTITLQQMPTEE